MTSTLRYAVMGLFAVGLLAASAASNLARAGTLAVCVDTSNPGHPMDLRVASAVAHQLGERLHVHRFDGGGGDEGFSLKHFRGMLDHDCSLVMGFPVETHPGAVTPPGTRATAPYARTGYVLVTPRRHGASTLSALPRGSRVAVTYQTTPNLYFATHPNLQADVYLNDKRSVQALRSGKVYAAMLWRPTVVHDLAADRTRFAEHPLDEPHANFNLVALYTDRATARRFNDALASLRRHCRLQKLLEPDAEPVPGNGATCARHASRHAARRHAGQRRAHTADPALPALYTGAQARDGHIKFEQHCSMCHGPMLEGRAGPALKGPYFASKQADFHVKDIFTILVHNMPATQPGSLPRQDYVDIMAFLLKENGYPRGSDKLTYDHAIHSSVKLRYHGH